MVSDDFHDLGSLCKIRMDGVVEPVRHRIPPQYNEFSYTRGFAAADDDRIVFAHSSEIYLYDGSDTAAALGQTVRKLADVRLGKYSAGSTMNIGSLGVNFQYESLGVQIREAGAVLRFRRKCEDYRFPFGGGRRGRGCRDGQQCQPTPGTGTSGYATAAAHR